MPTIEIDSDVFDAIKARALPWIDNSPSDTLRRLLALDGAQKTVAATGADQNGAASSPRHRASPNAPGRRQRKVDLWLLQQSGIVTTGQTLHLRDYAGKPVPGAEATVGPVNKLLMHTRRYSMSDLAARLLKRAGYAANSVRGPAHWFTAEGVSVLDLWKKYERENRS